MRWKAMAVAVVCGGCAIAAAPVATAQQTATVYVVHGVPDTPVDVYVDGQRAIDDFQPGSTQGPLQLPAGPHKVALFAATAPDGSGAPVLQADANAPAGANLTIVAHLNAQEAPTITPFVNDVGPVPAGQARLVVRHTAAAPAVDVRVGGKPVIQGLTNPQQKELQVPAGTVSADVTLAGTGTVAIGPAELDLAEGTATFVHAIGSAAKQNLRVVPITITGLHSAPSGVPAGTGTPAGALPWLLLAVTGVGVLAAGRRFTGRPAAG
ncbi:DUF4397 domain-containing protein [Actinophytocola sp.]|uniref:DUF4397 domain-containing protein n=1 Tax=Actinophytocola sp. TaxID=1872138 RepID=UPI002D7F24CF|nr:DUF4397 domain-containing protein [Actinophytocola sp.]HET9139162.1 DUF4397 domain-containing protein [Actinophytocola sp.]